MRRAAPRAWASRPPGPWCWAARPFWCWTRSGPWCCCDRAGSAARPAGMIQLDALAKAFGGRPVLAGVTLEVPDGQNTVIIGPSGSGKSVTLKCIVGLIEPDAGRVVVDGAVVQELDREALTDLRGRIGF